MISRGAGKVFLVQGKRTPFGKFGGSLATHPPVDLATYASRALFAELNLTPETVDQVIFSNVIPSTPETLYGGRHVVMKLGLPLSTPAHSVNRLCGSGIEAIVQAARLIRSQEADSLLVCGAENMSMAPHLLYGARFGTKYGPLPSRDLLLDTLTDREANVAMGITAENLAEKHHVSREAADLFSFNSHQKAAEAYAHNLIQPELAPVLKCESDEHVRYDVSLEEMAKLKPTFKKEGTVTAGSASGIVDGGAAVLIASEAAVMKNKWLPLAEIVDAHVVGVDPRIMGIGPVDAIRGLLKRQQLHLSQIDLFEINEAFASQVLACQKELGIPDEKLNVWGGAVALGHPLGATGIKISLTLARQMGYFNKTYGIASACIGGGQGIALLLKKV